MLLALLVAVGCSGGGTDASGETTNASTPETTSGSVGESTSPAPETTQRGGTTSGAPGNVNIEQVSSGSGGLGRRQVVVAPTADALSEATGARVPSAGEGTYLVVFWGEKPTGGYTVEILSARTEGSRIVVRLALTKPPPDAMVSQALTYPYAAAVLREVDTGEKEFVFVRKSGQEIGWSIRNV